MKKDQSEDDLTRFYIKSLKQFYIRLMIQGAMCVASLVVWMTQGGPFWPMWVIVACSIQSILEGAQLGKVPFITEIFPFLTPDWEEKELKKQLKKDKPNTIKNITHVVEETNESSEVKK